MIITSRVLRYDMQFDSESELLAFAKKLEGRRFSEISASIGMLDENHRRHTKGIAGKVIETEYFGIPSNSSEKPDFENLGIELKVSPLRYVERVNLYTTKERNVIKMVDYNEISKNKIWTQNKINTKLNRVLYVLYLHDNTVDAWEWTVVKTFLWTPSLSEETKIQKDYDIMRTKVLAGEHLREGDHSFLATCPKHGGGYLKGSPLSSPRSSLAVHPTLGFAEKRGYCIKREAFIELIAKSIETPLVKIGKTIGIESTKLELDR
jgi:DNA mismatch repair protein MutH